MWLWFITFILVVANGAGQIEGKRERLGSGRIAWCDPHLARFFHSFANKRVNNVYQFAPFYRQATFIYDELKMCTWAHVFKFKRRWYYLILYNDNSDLYKGAFWNFWMIQSSFLPDWYTGGPSSSCEMIILRSKSHGEIISVCMGIFTTTFRNKTNTVKFSLYLTIPHLTSTLHRLLYDHLRCWKESI